ncbi:unnamed protein product [Triticum turgidum subsp. durum]|uniref:Uncharacterized protein n=1 Tax=Triticum turgidum subsp. durum TaxID=4567 RepID=A0A9R1BEU7_TRITD|nr:unnamed protein product [Triticum turgidum subsp. durum]
MFLSRPEPTPATLSEEILLSPWRRIPADAASLSSSLLRVPRRPPPSTLPQNAPFHSHAAGRQVCAPRPVCIEARRWRRLGMPPTKEQAQVGQLGGGVESENSIDEKEEKELSRNLVVAEGSDEVLQVMMGMNSRIRKWDVRG